jgi:hypothetical protein
VDNPSVQLILVDTFVILEDAPTKDETLAGGLHAYPFSNQLLKV